MSESWSPEELQEAAARVVAELLQGAGITAPPVDALELAQHHLALSLAARKGSGSRQGRSEVVLPERSSPEEEQWLAAQAIGRHLQPELYRRLGEDSNPGSALARPTVVNLLAREVLIPAGWLAADARRCSHDLEELSGLYPTVSRERLAWRLLDLPTSCVITLVENDHVLARRSNAWRVGKALLPAEVECQRYVHDYSRPRVVTAAGWTVQGWPVHRPDWKREVLRSVFDEEGEAGLDFE